MSAPADLGVVTIGVDFTIQSWNPWLGEAVGVAPDQAHGRSLLSFVPPPRVDVIRSLLEEVLSTGATRVLAPAFHRNVIACSPRQPSRHFAAMQQFVTIAPLRQSGAISGAIITIEDVTPQLDRQRDLMARIESAPVGEAAADAIHAVGAADWQLRGLAVRHLRQRASTAEIAHLLDTLRANYHDLNVVSSALQVLAANRDVTTPLIELLSDAQAEVRMHAALALGKVGDPAAVPALIAALDDAEPNVRFHAIEALAAIGAGEAVDRLADIARSGDFFLSFPALEALARANDPRVGPALLTLLDDELLRPAVVGTLAALGDEDAVAPLVGVLNRGVDADAAAAIAAALDAIRRREEEAFAAGAHIVDLARAALRPTGIAALASAVEQKRSPLTAVVAVLGWTRADALQPLLRVVGESDVEAQVEEALTAVGAPAVDPLIALLTSPERHIRHAAASLLGALGDRRAVPALVATLDSADTELIVKAAAALARLEDPSALDALFALFRHEHASVRQAAVAAVNAIGSPVTVDRIVPRIADADAHVRASAARVAGYFGFDAAAPALVRALDDSDEEVRRAAIEQLPLIDDRRSAALLAEAVRRETPRNRAAAAHALRLVNDECGTAALLDALDDEDAWVRYFAAGALAARRVTDALSPLTRLADNDRAPHVRIAALDALRSIDPEVAGEIALPLVKHPEPEVAAAAVMAVAAGSNPAADELLDQALKSPNPFLVRAAVQGLAGRATARAAELLTWAACLSDPSEIAPLAIESLGRIASRQDDAARRAAIAGLVELAVPRETRALALRALGGLPPAAIDEIASRLRARGVATRLVAVEALARMRHQRASEAMLPALADADAAVRRVAISAFGRLGTRAAAGAIGRLAESDPDEGVRRLANAMCQRHHWPCGSGR